jgi:DNA-binding transcriptional regulator YiaG
MPRAKGVNEWDVLKGHIKMARYLGVSVRTLQRWIQRGLKIPGNPRPICTRGQLMRAVHNMQESEK